jgi:apolipoprotein D and lipocalin family protein
VWQEELMIRVITAVLAAVLPFAMWVVACGGEKTPSLQVVSSVDLGRYMGTWYEIARYPNRFQRDCAGDVMATYELREDGKVRVVNACREADGEAKTSEGTARVVDPKTNARLKVTFFWPFSGDYWIINLGPNYEYAVVGEPSREYLWILSRTPRMDDATYGVLLERIAKQGYDTSKLVRTPQSAG